MALPVSYSMNTEVPIQSNDWTGGRSRWRNAESFGRIDEVRGERTEGDGRPCSYGRNSASDSFDIETNGKTKGQFGDTRVPKIPEPEV